MDFDWIIQSFKQTLLYEDNKGVLSTLGICIAQLPKEIIMLL